MRRLVPLTLAAAAALAWAAPASAGTVSVTDGTRVVFADTAGDPNTLVVARTGGDVTLTDSSAPLTAGDGCTQQGASQALCRIDPDDPRAAASFDLGGGSDSADLTALSLVAGVTAGAGDDTVQGTDTFDSLRGGGGADKLYGNAGNDILADEDVASGEVSAGPDTLDGGADNDVAEYTDRGPAQSLSIDLASGEGGAGDTLAQIEAVTTGPAADTVYGDAADNSLSGSGRDKLRGRGGDDELATDSGGRLSGGAGDDKLEVTQPDGKTTAITCGAAHDSVISFPVDRLARDCEHARVGNVVVGIEGLKDVGSRLRARGVLRFRLQCAFDDGCGGRMRLLRSNGSVASRASYGVTDDPSYVSFRLRRADRKRLARGHVFTFASTRKGAAGFRMFLKTAKARPARAAAFGAPAAASAKTVGPGANGSQVSLGNTETLKIRLRPADSASSGYHWRVAKKPAASVLRLVSSKSTSEGAQQVFTLKARGAGQTSLRLEYVAPGRGARPTKVFRLSVAVRTSGRGAPRSCPRRGSTVAQNRYVRVYEVGSSLRACRRATGRSVELARASDDFTSSSSYADVRLAGTFVAWSEISTDSSCKADCPPGYDGTTRSIAIYDVRNGATRGVNAYPSRSALVLSKFGAVAWAEQANSGAPTEIHVSTKDGEDRVIDSGNIDPATLAIEITIISWTRDGEERFTRLR